MPLSSEPAWFRAKFQASQGYVVRFLCTDSSLIAFINQWRVWMASKIQEKDLTPEFTFDFLKNDVLCLPGCGSDGDLELLTLLYPPSKFLSYSCVPPHPFHAGLGMEPRLCAHWASLPAELYPPHGLMFLHRILQLYPCNFMRLRSTEALWGHPTPCFR